jgi:hypothetical protein
MLFAQNRLKCPVYTRYPANGMMISDGSGMQADSIAMRATMPAYPNVPMTWVMK